MPSGELEQALGETKKAAKDLAVATARLTKRILHKADRAAQNPTASVEKAARKVAKELDAMAKEIDRLLKDL